MPLTQRRAYIEYQAQIYIYIYKTYMRHDQMGQHTFRRKEEKKGVEEQKKKKKKLPPFVSIEPEFN